MLHGSSNAWVNKIIARPPQIQVAAESKETVTIGGDEVLLQLQTVRFRGGDIGLVFFDNGSTVVIVRNDFSARLGLKGRKFYNGCKSVVSLRNPGKSLSTPSPWWTGRGMNTACKHLGWRRSQVT